MTKPFQGVKVLDFTQVFAGPFGSYQLALLGADIIKIERPGGEDMRYAPPADDWSKQGLSTHWLAINANKRSLVLDLKQPDAIEIVKRLAASADVVMENFKAGTMDKLGIGYQALSEINPKLIYCAVCGFGQNGPERGAAGYDGKIQALSGIMSITGHPEMGPMRAGFAVCDALSGMTSAFAVASALYQRTHTGKGQMVDVAMLDATLTFLSPNVVEYLVGGHKAEQFGNQAISRRPTANLFRAKDSYLLLAVNNERQYQCLLKALNLGGLQSDPRFADWESRVENAEALRAAIEQALSEKDAKSWEQELNQAGAPCSSIWHIEDVVAHPQLQHRDVLQKVSAPYGEINLIGSGFRLAHGGGSVETAPPRIGEHSAEILSQAGYSAHDIASLQSQKVI